MLKSKFMGWCKRHESRDAPLSVDEGTEYRGDNREIHLNGVWGRGSILSITLYTPTPGRQGHDQNRVYRDAHEKIKKEIVKYRRWLAEFQAANGGPDPGDNMTYIEAEEE